MLPMDQTRLRDKYSLAFRPPSPPLPLQWREMTDDEIMELEIPGVDLNAPPTLHSDQVDMAICEKLRVSIVTFTRVDRSLIFLFIVGGGQEIDNNMAAVHSVLAYEILPGLKEYARVTEPIREVSRVSEQLCHLSFSHSAYIVLDQHVRSSLCSQRATRSTY